MKLNGKEYPVPVIKSFKDMAKLELKGVKIMALMERSFFDPENLATSFVKGISYYTGLPFDEALDEMDTHITNGGNLDDILEELFADIDKMGDIAKDEGFSMGAKAPQDHKKPATKKKSQ